MLSRERVIRTINHQPVDRVPVYGWVRWNLEKQITEAFGSVEAFEDRYEFDLAHLFSNFHPYSWEAMNTLRNQHGGVIEPSILLDVALPDVNDHKAYQRIIDGVKFHKEGRGRFVYAHTPGIFEVLNGVFGIENHLAFLLLHEEDLQRVYKRQAEWNRQFALNCLDLGVDMIHVSDDWGGQNRLLFSPDVWWRMIYPYHKITCTAVQARGAFLSLHSCGCVLQVIDGIIDLGYQVLHPWQESAGMSLELFRDKYSQKLTLMGGLDVQTTLGFGNREHLEKEIRRVFNTLKDGGLIFCTSHFVQDHCSMDELRFAFETVRTLNPSSS